MYLYTFKQYLESSERIILAIFGPSGSGKTTLLNAINEDLNSDKKVGFMPQNCSLCENLTVEENLKIFSLIYSLDLDRQSGRIYKIFKVLEVLDKIKSIVGELSEGGKRRISLSLALIHEPKFLILDEPTAGIDFILRRKIWNFLNFYCTQKGAKIIFSSHCWVEAERADVVAFLRNGNIFCQDSPKNLVKKFIVDSIDEVFLKLSKDQKESTSFIPTKRKKVERNRINSNNFKALIWLILQSMKRNWRIEIFFLLLPTINFILFRQCFGQMPQKIILNVLNDEAVIKDQGQPLSVEFLVILETDLKFKFMNARNKKSHATLTFLPNFSKNFVKFIENSTLKVEEGNENLIKVEQRENDPFLALFLKDKIIKAFYKLTERVHKAQGFNPSSSRIPLVFEKPIFGQANFDVSKSAMPGFLIMTLFLSSLYASCINMRTYNGDFFERCQLMKVSKFEEVLANYAAKGLYNICHSLILILYVFLTEFANHQSSLLYFLQLLLVSLCGSLLGQVIFMSSKSQRTILIISIGVTFINLFLSTALWPIQGMAKPLQRVSSLLPLYHPIESIRSILWQKVSFFSVKVLKGFSILSLWICGLIFLNYFIIVKLH